jgi:hypothetical protein
MRTNHLKSWVAVLTMLAFSSSMALAQDSSAAKAVQPEVAGQSVPQLTYGASQILQLARADVGDETIIAYIKTSGDSFSLNPDQIIYLRQQGVSATVVTTMLSQPKPSPPNDQSVPGNRVDTVTAANQDPAAPVSSDQAMAANGNGEPACIFYPDPLAPDSAGSRVTIIYYQTARGSTCYYQPHYAPVLGGDSAALPSIGFGGRWGGGWHGGWRGDISGGGRRGGFHTSGGFHGGEHR